MGILKISKENLITAIFMLFVLAGYVFFPANNFFQYKAVSLISLVLLPFLYNKYFLKKENIFRKFLLKDYLKNLQWLALGLLFAFLVAIILNNITDVQKHYLLSPNVKNNFLQFLLYEFTGVAFTVAIYEFFFRGFVMFYFSVFFGKWSILVQFLFFCVMLAMLNLPYWFYITYLVFTPFGGWIAYKSDSVLYSLIGQFIFIVFVDASFIAMTIK